MIRSSALQVVPGVVHGFTTRTTPVPAPPPMASAPSQLGPVLAALGAPGADVAMLNQVHGAVVLEARLEGPLWPVGVGDALVCAAPGLVVYVRVADCVPVLVAGPRGVAAIHAGWRGSAEGVVRAAVERLVELSGHEPRELTAAVGPSIGPCCYEVGPEVVAALSRQAPPSVFLHERAGRRPTVDVAAAAEHVLRTVGVATIERLPGCTRCDGGFHSFRRDGASAGRQAALIGLLR